MSRNTRWNALEGAFIRLFRHKIEQELHQSEGHVEEPIDAKHVSGFGSCPTNDAPTRPGSAPASEANKQTARDINKGPSVYEDYLKLIRLLQCSPVSQHVDAEAKFIHDKMFEFKQLLDLQPPTEDVKAVLDNAKDIPELHSGMHDHLQNLVLREMEEARRGHSSDSVTFTYDAAGNRNTQSAAVGSFGGRPVFHRLEQLRSLLREYRMTQLSKGSLAGYPQRKGSSVQPAPSAEPVPEEKKFSESADSISAAMSLAAHFGGSLLGGRIHLGKDGRIVAIVGKAHQTEQHFGRWIDIPDGETQVPQTFADTKGQFIQRVRNTMDLLRNQVRFGSQMEGDAVLLIDGRIFAVDSEMAISNRINQNDISDDAFDRSSTYIIRAPGADIAHDAVLCNPCTVAYTANKSGIEMPSKLMHNLDDQPAYQHAFVGRSLRPFLWCVIRKSRDSMARVIPFLVDTGSPRTYLPKEFVDSMALDRKEGDSYSVNFFFHEYSTEDVAGAEQNQGACHHTEADSGNCDPNAASASAAASKKSIPKGLVRGVVYVAPEKESRLSNLNLIGFDVLAKLDLHINTHKCVLSARLLISSPNCPD